MNNKTDHIFRRLRHLEIKAPEGLWDVLCRKLFTEDTKTIAGQVKDFTINPPDELFTGIEKEIEDIRLQSDISPVKDTEIKPADNLFENITAAIEQENKKTKAKVLTPVFVRTLLVAAGITGILLLSIYFKDLFLPRGDVPAATITQTKQPENGNRDKLQRNVVIKPAVQDAKHKNQYPAFGGQTFKRKQFLDISTTYLNGKKIQIRENDLLYSFAGCNYTSGKKYFPKTNSVQEVTIDGFGNITISPFVYTVISDLYQVKRNGRLTRKAKRAKVKIEKWRKHDVQLFDKGLKYNPLDIIDLAETVYKK